VIVLYSKDHIGCNRGQAAMRLLLELNPEVRGDCVDERADQILSQRPDFFKVSIWLYNFNNKMINLIKVLYYKVFSIVIGSNIDEKTTTTLSKLLWEWNIPFIIVKSYGFLGYIRLQVKPNINSTLVLLRKLSQSKPFEC